MPAALNLTANQIRSMVSRYKKGETARDLATRFNISPSSVLNYLRDEGVRIRSRGRRSAE